MADSNPAYDPVDRLVERIMLGQDPDVEALIAETPGMEPATRDKLRRVAGAFGPAAPAAAAELPFAELGPYKLLSRMGEGGMGVVYLAEQRFLARRVALKIIRPELALSQVTRQRFQREAMRIAKLRHENVVSVYDAGEHEGIAFLAMEVVEGHGLDELLRAARGAGERLDLTPAVRHARDIARALQCAHSAGIVHRDVKPSNIRITPDGRALLLDFGLSLGEEAASVSSLGQFRGTPQYASPEQIEPGSAEVDARTDVYSLGVTLYECLTGRLPFESASMVQLFHQILASDPPEPRRLNELVDQTLNDIVLRAMARRRDDRFGSAGELAQALEGWLVSEQRAAPPARRGRPWTVKGLAVAAVILLGVAAWSLLHHRAARTTLLFGDSSRAFDQRLSQWAPVVGGGTFGADEDGTGVLGVSVEGLSAEPCVLPAGEGSVRGRIEPVAPAPGVRTGGAGAGIECSDGRIVALLLTPGADGYDVRVCELLREGDSRLRRGTELGTGKLAARDGQPLVFRVSWTGTNLRFDWSEGGTILVPGSAHPSRFLLVVEQGSARFDEFTLEES